MYALVFRNRFSFCLWSRQQRTPPRFFSPCTGETLIPFRHPPSFSSSSSSFFFFFRFLSPSRSARELNGKRLRKRCESASTLAISLLEGRLHFPSRFPRLVTYARRAEFIYNEQRSVLKSRFNFEKFHWYTVVKTAVSLRKKINSSCEKIFAQMESTSKNY